MLVNWIIPNWPAPTAIKAVSTLRSGGVSQSPFFSFNLGNYVGDDPMSVAENRIRLNRGLELPSEPCWLNQVHGSSVIQAGRNLTNNIADASYTRDKGVVCAVLTADCLPILITDQSGSFVAVIHCGWRGLLSGIIQNTLRVLEGLDLLAWLGPAIGADNFKVRQDVRSAFVKKSQCFESGFKLLFRGCWGVNIYQIARTLLERQGISRIYGGDFCTYSEEDRFFSYRRDGKTGRMATIIWRE